MGANPDVAIRLRTPSGMYFSRSVAKATITASSLLDSHSPEGSTLVSPCPLPL